MKKLCFCFMLIFSMTVCHGGAVQWDIAQWGYDLDFGHLLAITAPNGGGIQIGMILTSTLTQATLKNNLDWHTLGYGVLLLQTNYNTLIDDDFFNNSPDPFFNTYTSSGFSMSEMDLSIPHTNSDFSNTILLAFAIGGLDWSGEFVSEWYGWIEFGYTIKDGVYIANSGVETTGLGIYAGTGNAVPEPSTVLLAMSGGTILLLRRRKRKITP